MISYRRDIDGLRAISIIAVLMFHGGFADWGGGFVGVDVFFVISGFLITSLISAEISEGRFELLKFYERRVRRLLAPAIPVIVFTTVFAWLFYTTDRFLEYSQSLIAFATYTSNWYFLHGGGYFAASTETAPLLHTWSLAVEEQFYLVFPFLMMVLCRKPNLLNPALAIAALTSLLYSQRLLDAGHPDLAFYSSFSRIWELLLGALIALNPSLRSRFAALSSIMRAAGLALILIPVFSYSAVTPFPAFAALAPTFGALLLLAASPDKKDPILAILESGAAVYIGRISYVLYLWHWPVLAAMRTLVFSHNDLHVVIAILMTIVLSSISHKWIEQPIRKRTILPRGRDLAALLTATTLVSLAIGTYGWFSNGWPGRISAEVELTASQAVMHLPDPEKCFNVGDGPNKFCKSSPAPGSKVDIVLWGDSHAQSVTAAFRRYAGSKGLVSGFALHGDCLPLLGVWRSKDGLKRVCRKFNDEAMDFIRTSDTRLVVIVARWSAYTSGPQFLIDDQHTSSNKTKSQDIFEASLDRTLTALAGKTVVIVEQVPQNRGDLPSAFLVLSRLGLPLDRVAPVRDQHLAQQRFLTEALNRASIKHKFVRIDPAAALCSGETCTVQADGKLLYFDDDHLNLAGSQFLYPFLESELNKAQLSAAIPLQ
jgi:peptidoglycan/LPS O-acetylase OafA/YrhL